MKKLVYLSLLILFVAIQSLSQTQQRIPWPSIADSPWPVVRGDVQGTGRSEYIGPNNPQIIWEKTYPLGIQNGPVIGREGNIFFGTVAGNFGYAESYFYAADSMGNQVWRFETDNWVPNNCAPLVGADGTIYFGTQGPDPAYFYALNNDGTLKWKYESNSPFNLKNLILDDNGNIFTATSDSLLCFNNDGVLSFTLGIPGIIAHGITISPSGDTLYVPSVYSNHSDYIYHLYSISTSGEIFWKKQFDRIGTTTALVDNSNKIYIQAEPLNNPRPGFGSLFCLNPDGSVNWVFNNGAYPNIWDSGGPTMDRDGNITFSGVIENGNDRKWGLASLDYYGNLRWTYTFELEDWFEEPYLEIDHGLVCDAEGTIYAAAKYGYYLYAITNEGQLKWKVRLKDYYVSANPVINKDGTIYLGLHHGAWENDLENNLLAIADVTNSIEDEETPTEFNLEQNYPNPFNPSTRIKYQVSSIEKISLKVYDILGREVAVLINETKPVGTYEVEFDGINLTSGVYFYVLQSGDIRISKKMLLLS